MDRLVLLICIFMLSLILDQLTDSPKHIADLDEAKDLIDNLGEINNILEI